jgi:dienelactone hydrolase
VKRPDYTSKANYTVSNHLSRLRVVILTPTNAPVERAAPVLLLHEITGVSPACLDFAERLANAGPFVVYIPQLFGGINEPGSWPTIRNFINVSFNCRWRTVVSGSTSPAFRDIPPLVQRIASAHSNRKLGVIGMCLTGSWPLALMTDSAVQIAVICQPAVPFVPCTANRRRDLALCEADLRPGVERIRQEHLTLLGVRFSNDSKSTAERLWNVRDLLGSRGRFVDATIAPQEYSTNMPANAHSVFTAHFADECGRPFPATQRRFDQLVDEFRAALFR